MSTIGEEILKKILNNDLEMIVKYDQAADVINLAIREVAEEHLRKFAWWENGVQYLGTCGWTLKNEVAKLKSQYPLLSEGP